MKKYILMGLAGLFTIVSLVGCNTMRGAGEDVSAAGHSIQRAAQ